MSQHDMNIANQGFPAFREDLNDALPALASNSSGATEPSTMFAHQWWVDTSATPNLLKQRNADNDAWITVGSLDQAADTFNVAVAQGGTGSATASGARTAFGVVIGTDVQANLVSGTNIKTINSTSLLGSGDIDVSLSSLGYGQTWQSPTRALGTTYYNLTGKPIAVSIKFGNTSGGDISILVNGLSVSEMSFGTVAIFPFMSAIVPVGASYSATNNVSGFSFWRELR